MAASSNSFYDAYITSNHTNSASVGDLPLELHQQILSYLPWKDQLNCEHVCRAWREDLRGRVSEPRSVIAPWLPVQDFDFALYGALTVHTLVTNGVAFSFKCHEGYKLASAASVVPDHIFHELGGALADDHIAVVQCIDSFNFIEKSGKGADTVLTKSPVSNLSFLDDMLVMPAYVDEDEIHKLYCRFNRQEPVQKKDKTEESENNGGSSDQLASDNNDDDDGDGDNDGDDDGDDDDNDDGNDDGNDGDNGGDNDSDDEEDDEDNSNSPVQTRIIVSSGNFTTNVNLNPDDGTSNGIYYRLTLGALLVKMRENLLSDVFRVQGIDASNTTYPVNLGPEGIMQIDEERARKRKEFETGTVLIEQLTFERCREQQALSISFNGMIIPDGTEVIF